MGLTHEELKKLCHENMKKLCCYQFLFHLLTLTHRSTMASMSFANSNAFVAPSTAMYDWILVSYIFFSYLSQLYKIPTVLMSEISCIENDSETPTEEGAAIASSHSIVSPFLHFHVDGFAGFPPEPTNPKKPRFLPLQKSVRFYSQQRIPSLLSGLSQVSPRVSLSPSSVRSPRNFDREDQLFNRVKFLRAHDQSALLFGKPYSDVTEADLAQRTARILRRASEKGVSPLDQNHYLQAVSVGRMNDAESAIESGSADAAARV